MDICWKFSRNPWFTLLLVFAITNLCHYFFARFRTCIMASRSLFLHLFYAFLQGQENGSDCSVFAIAFAMSICNMQNPGELKFHIPKMTRHLLSAWKTNRCASFHQTITITARLLERQKTFQFIASATCRKKEIWSVVRVVALGTIVLVTTSRKRHGPKTPHGCVHLVTTKLDLVVLLLY